MIEARQIDAGIVALHQGNLAQYQLFLAQHFGSFTILPFLRYADLKGSSHSCISAPCIESTVIILK